MLSLAVCTLFVGAMAVPLGPRPSYSNYRPGMYQRRPYFNENLFDTGRFWSDLSRELRDLDDMLADFSRRFPTSVSQAGFEGNEYKITIPLAGFEEKDIVVKAREGMLMVQAIHKFDQGSERNYLDVRTLPDSVNVTGNWIFEGGVLKIIFPVKGATTPEVTTEAVFVTQNPQSREEIETRVDESNQDADVGLQENNRGDLGATVRSNNDRELITNEISRNSVEATTYAVDLKDEVEFVPVKY